MASSIARRVLERYPLPNDSPFVNQFFNLLYGRKPEPGPLVDFVVERIWETGQGVMARRLAQLESFDVSDQLWRIDVPTLVLAGGRDVIVPPSRQQALAKSIAGAQYEVLPDAGHIGFLTHRAEFVRGVRQALESRQCDGLTGAIGGHDHANRMDDSAPRTGLALVGPLSCGPDPQGQRRSPISRTPRPWR